MKFNLTFITLLLLISFASVNAVLFTPALPDIANFFAISDSKAQLTITWFLVGYTIGQLLYGPFANRFGRKPALYAGIILQIVSSLLCVVSGLVHNYTLLVLGRLLLALGSGVGLKMTFTLINEMYEPTVANQKLSYLMIAFAITPGLGTMIGGYLSADYGWISTFIASAFYGVILLLLTTKLPETKNNVDKDALRIDHLIDGYAKQFTNLRLIAGGLLMGGATCFVYIFAALAPFIAMNMMHMDVSTYGTANLLPPIGLVTGSLVSAQLVKYYKPTIIIAWGIFITGLGSLMMFVLMLANLSPLLTIFAPMVICYFGLSLVFANASTIAMSNTADKAHGSAVMNFINMGLVTGIVLSLGMLTMNNFLLPAIYISICIFMAGLNKFAFKEAKQN